MCREAEQKKHPLDTLAGGNLRFIPSIPSSKAPTPTQLALGLNGELLEIWIGASARCSGPVGQNSLGPAWQGTESASHPSLP